MVDRLINAKKYIFKQDTIDRAAYIEEVYDGGGYFALTGETAAVQVTTPKVGYKLTTYVKDYTDSVFLSKDLFDDNMHGVWRATVSSMSMRARRTMDNNAFALYRNATTTTLTADGVSFANAAHPLLGGGTQSNLLTTTALSNTNLNLAIVALRQQKDQGGVIMGNVPAVLLVPTPLFQLATQLTQSVLVGDASTNAINVWRSAMGITCWTSPFLDAVAGGSDTTWFLLSNTHQVTRVVRQGIQTALTDWSYSTNRTYKYQCNYREMYKVVDYAGAVICTA